MVPVHFPKVTIVKRVRRGGVDVAELCFLAGRECRVTGPAAHRRVKVYWSSSLTIMREPGPMSAVAIGIPHHTKKPNVLVLGVLAYAIHDYATRESVRGWSEMSCGGLRGRPRSTRPLTGAERQRRWRNRHRPAD
jgi:hypothetical protein